MTLRRCCLTFSLCFSLLLGFLSSKVNTGFDDPFVSYSSEEPEGITITVEPHSPGWSKIIKKNSNGDIVEETYCPDDRVPAYISQGSSSSNPIPVEDSDSSASSPKPVEDSKGSVSDPISVEDSDDSASDSEKKEEAPKPKNSSSNNDDENGKGGGLNPSDIGSSSNPKGPDVGNSESSGNNASKVIGKLAVILGSMIAGLSDFFDNLP